MNIVVISLSLSLSLSRIYNSLIGAVIYWLSSCSLCRFVALVQSCERERPKEKKLFGALEGLLIATFEDPNSDSPSLFLAES